MKKKGRRLRSFEASRQARRSWRADTSEAKSLSTDGSSLPKAVPITPPATQGFYQDNAAPSHSENSNASTNDKQKSKSAGKLSSAVCRLCHGKFSPRSLRCAFNKWAQDSISFLEEESDTAAQSALIFHTDFQQLVGVPMDRDPRLSEFICKKCHNNFYKCRNILIRFLQRVNVPAVGKKQIKTQKSPSCPQSSADQASTPPSFTSDGKCLHSLVSWAHHHGEACHSCPDLKEVLEGQCWGSVKAVWGCVDGHSYIMDTQYGIGSSPLVGKSRCALSCSSGPLVSGSCSRAMTEEEEEDQVGSNGRNITTSAQHSPPATTAQTQIPALEDWTGHPEEFTGLEVALSPAADRLEDRSVDSDLSARVISDDEFEDCRKSGFSEDELFPRFLEKRVIIPSKKRPSPKGPQEAKVRKKPGPKPGWKNKFKPKGEELPTIYKCPYQSCTAVYRAPDGLKKHIKEHHEEVRERPCPHPGCNKVFMIDRYLQRHVKLIHTEERNYICDQCGQTFKQRKHLSVHQMRHSGAKPLQCEVCGFQCRQRASLKYHMTKHKAEADLEYACLLCGKRFEKAHNLNVHMSMVHPLTQAEPQSSQQQKPAESQLQTITLTGELIHQDRSQDTVTVQVCQTVTS
ncbi:zinc finger protein 276 isoform X2 [Thalassophryne amazonica]|uniref:zinc finger protein 276 isoform X2 n=1 Tax=Thalassophryne amazonica TaxID=390379 RepID=UPI001471C0CE|nr:zinc finger protein 276 isoform X2 [Thalassophryne amazonica]